MSLPGAIPVVVSADDIANGTPESWSDDPIARAVQRAVGTEYRVESAQYVMTIFEGPQRHRYSLPREANEFIEAYDDPRLRPGVSPFSFVLTRFEADCFRIVNRIAEPGRTPPTDASNTSRGTHHGD
jgi:hypothetical protein